ncbi:MAG: hypothetical protein KGL13_03480 [Gammaproteobacteria bacterium]|nr:hypothetical protein [Gammaproteobacteria bacterium]
MLIPRVGMPGPPAALAVAGEELAEAAGMDSGGVCLVVSDAAAGFVSVLGLEEDTGAFAAPALLVAAPSGWVAVAAAGAACTLAGGLPKAALAKPTTAAARMINRIYGPMLGLPQSANLLNIALEYKAKKSLMAKTYTISLRIWLIRLRYAV